MKLAIVTTFGMREVVVEDLDELETMYQEHPIGSIYTKICKGIDSKCALWIYTNSVSIIATNNT